MINEDLVVLAQGFALLFFLLKTIVTAVAFLPYAFLRCVAAPKASTNESKASEGPVVYYEGTVYHIRRKPVVNSFRC